MRTQANYREIPELIKRRWPFKGSSARAINDNDGYKVYSYNELIYHNGPRGQTLNVRLYSQTTSRIQGIIARVIYGKTLKEMRKHPELATKG